jgi:hypothetical protein
MEFASGQEGAIALQNGPNTVHNAFNRGRKLPGGCKASIKRT